MKPKIVVAVTGGRKFNDFWCVQRAMVKVDSKYDVAWVMGDQSGAEQLAALWCQRVSALHFVFNARDGQQRIYDMLAFRPLHLVLAFAGGDDVLINHCQNAGIPIKQIAARVTNDSPQGVKESASEGAAGTVQHLADNTAGALASS